MSRYFITGTDTGVGKTVASLCFMKHLYEKGKNPFYLKPFQTGCDYIRDKDSDPWFIYKHIEELKNCNPEDSVIYLYKRPLAPYFAARHENRLDEITLRSVLDYIKCKEKDHSDIVIEGAGGIHVPITKDKLIIDYLEDLDCKVIVVARAGLGTINHTLLTIESLERRKIDIAGIVLIDKNGDVSKISINENIEAITSFTNKRILGVIKKMDNFNNVNHINVSFFDNI